MNFGGFPDNSAEKYHVTDFCVYLIIPYIIRSKWGGGGLITKSVIMIDSVIRWFKTDKYNDKK